MMPAKILDGKKESDKILARLKGQVCALRLKGIIPKLVVVQVGRDASSTIYVEKKHKTCLEVGIDSEMLRLGENVPYGEFIAEIEKLNSDPKVHGILVQSPLPAQISSRPVYEVIDVAKDVDGWHPHNQGMNLLGKQGLQPATPKGVMKLIESTGVRLEGKNAVVIGRSSIVGKPVSLMLVNAGCTVTICNSKTKKLADFTKKADLLVSAAGKPGLVKAKMVKKGAIVIDVGTTRGKGGKVKGDVDFEKVRKKASWITPVPGGVGPMTIASLIENTVKACMAIEWEKLQAK